MLLFECVIAGCALMLALAVRVIVFAPAPRASSKPKTLSSGGRKTRASSQTRPSTAGERHEVPRLALSGF